MDKDGKSILEAVADVAEFANAVASLVVGHRKILVDGGFDVNLSDSMAASLHAQLLGLVHHWELEDDQEYDLIAYPNDDDDDE
jgi:hypothetical protein